MQIFQINLWSAGLALVLTQSRPALVLSWSRYQVPVLPGCPQCQFPFSARLKLPLISPRKRVPEQAPPWRPSVGSPCSLGPPEHPSSLPIECCMAWGHAFWRGAYCQGFITATSVITVTVTVTVTHCPVYCSLH